MTPGQCALAATKAQLVPPAKLPCPLAVVLLPYLPTTNRPPWPPLVQERQMGGYRAEERLAQVGGACCRPARRAASASTPVSVLARPAAPVHQPSSPCVSAACQLLPSSLLFYLNLCLSARLPQEVTGPEGSYAHPAKGAAGAGGPGAQAGSGQPDKAFRLQQVCCWVLACGPACACMEWSGVGLSAL